MSDAEPQRTLGDAERFAHVRNSWIGQATLTAQTYRAGARIGVDDLELWQATYDAARARFADFSHDQLLMVVVASAELIATAAEMMARIDGGDRPELIEIPAALRPHHPTPEGDPS